MVARDVVAAGVTHPRVITALRRTPRHEFVPLAERRLAYFDMALPIGEQQTISPPFVVATMTAQLDPQPNDKVLEIGTGSGYQAAILAGVVGEVYTIEIHEPLARTATQTLSRLGYKNVHVKIGDGFQGWPEHAPFDKIIVTCSPEKVPQPLVDQLREGGRMVDSARRALPPGPLSIRKTGRQTRRPGHRTDLLRADDRHRRRATQRSARRRTGVVGQRRIRGSGRNRRDSQRLVLRARRPRSQPQDTGGSRPANDRFSQSGTRPRRRRCKRSASMDATFNRLPCRFGCAAEIWPPDRRRRSKPR